MSNYTTSKNNNLDGIKFLVLSVGGAGGNAIQHIMNQNIADVGLVAVDTDAQVLSELTVPIKYQLGKKNLGNRPPEIRQMLAETHQDDLRALLSGYDMVFIAAGLGGGTGTGVTPVIARLAKEMGILSMAVVAMPFGFEGKERAKIAKQGLDDLLSCADSVMMVSNDKILAEYHNLSIDDAFRKADDVLSQAVQGIVELILNPTGMIGVDFVDMARLVRSSGHAMVGVGRASGNNRAIVATEQAINSPLLNNSILKRAKYLLASIKGSRETLFLNEGLEMSKLLTQITGLEDDHQIFWSMVYDETMGNELQVTVIAMGIEVNKLN